MDILSSAVQNIEGFVEAIINDTIYGWVTVDPARFSLSAKLGESIVGTAEEFVFRADLSSKSLAKGFAIKCDKSVTPAHLAEGKLQVVAINSHSMVSLPVWLPLLEASAFLNINLSDLKRAWNSVPSESKNTFVRELGIVQGGCEFGRVSSDGVVQAGRNGYLFLLSGKNQVSDFYKGELKIEIDNWITCFLRRQKILKAPRAASGAPKQVV